jgi:hypothetical protein
MSNESMISIETASNERECENDMEEIIADYIISASHLDQLRASRGDIGAVLSAHRASSAPPRTNESTPRPSPWLVSAAAAPGSGIHHSIETELDSMRCRTAFLRRAVADREAPARRATLSRSLRVRPGRLFVPELLRTAAPPGPLSPADHESLPHASHGDSDGPASWARVLTPSARASAPARPWSAIAGPAGQRAGPLAADPARADRPRTCYPGPGRDTLRRPGSGRPAGAGAGRFARDCDVALWL